MLGKPIVYIENYLSSEGFIDIKTREHAKACSYPEIIIFSNSFRLTIKI